MLARTCIYKNDYAGQPYWERAQLQEPVPRFAHQLVYSHTNRVSRPFRLTGVADFHSVKLLIDSIPRFCQHGNSK